MVQIKPSQPDSSLGFKVEVLKKKTRCFPFARQKLEGVHARFFGGHPKVIFNLFGKHGQFSPKVDQKLSNGSMDMEPLLRLR